MSRSHARRLIPQSELLEPRVQQSVRVPANSIGVAQGAVSQRGAVMAVSVAVAAQNLTVGKPSTVLGVFAARGPGSTLAPRIVAVTESDGRTLSIKQGRPFEAGRADGQAAAF